MNDLQTLLLFTTLAGMTIPLGGLLASIESIHPRWLEAEFRHFVAAIGGGALLAAVALVLVPEGAARVSVVHAIIAMLVGGGLMMLLERWLAAHGGSAAQFLAMMLDFLPETIALGALYVEEPAVAPLLALLIAAQNFPEGFNALRELCDSGMRKSQILLLFILLVPLGPLMGITGRYVFTGASVPLGFIMLASSGGILYLIFQDIAPQVPLKRHWAPPLGAVMGFLIGLSGHMLLH